MKIEIGSYKAKTKLPELLRQVKAGKSFTMTKDKIVSVEKLKAFMLADPMRGVNIKNLAEKGRA